ncbi:hypothetical protein [Maribacter arcticus]|uniref:hypothetical protein n=2 Tax=Maribacter arcticus TaxID=561365 RepID=UPI00300339A2
MSIFLKVFTIEHESEHVLEHDLSTKSNFSVPKIYTAKGDLSKRWYVYFSFLNPETNKMQRMKNIYGKANKFNTKANCQMTTNEYEVEIDKLLAEKNPDYYDGLKKILSEFPKSLISKGIIVDGTYQSYAGLLKQISEDDKMAFQIEYDLKRVLKRLG